MKTATGNDYKITGAKVINLKTGEEEDLIQKPDYRKKDWSNCLFRKDNIQYNGYDIQLRFDFSDLDENDDPTLDVDYSPKDKVKPGPHHILKTYDGGIAVYRFKFGDFEMVLKLSGRTTDLRLNCTYKVKTEGPNGEVLIQ